MKPIILRTDNQRKRVIDEINRLPVNPVYQVVISKYEEKRTINQNALMWMWTGIIGGYVGESKEECHRRHKRDYLKPIYTRDDPEFAETVETVRGVYLSGMKEQARLIMERIVDLISTTTATKKQLAEFMDEIEAEARNLNINLPQPGDL